METTSTGPQMILSRDLETPICCCALWPMHSLLAAQPQGQSSRDAMQATAQAERNFIQIDT